MGKNKIELCVEKEIILLMYLCISRKGLLRIILIKKKIKVFVKKNVIRLI